MTTTKKNVKKSEKEGITFAVEKRSIQGKKVKQLRKKGIIPANIYGENFQSISIQFSAKDFFKVYKKARGTQIINLQLENKTIPALIHIVQKDPVSGALFHVDFRKVNLSKKIETHIPVKFIGQSEAVMQNKGILLTLTDKLTVESLPTDIPSIIEVDISPLKELNQEIKVKDLPVSTTYVYKDEPEKVIVRITEHKEESAESQIVAPETVEVTTEKKEESTEKTTPEEKKAETNTEKPNKEDNE